jgi:hypothetical protein
VTCLSGNPDVEFELFGSIPMPAELEPFGGRITVVPPVREYAKFMQAFAERRWDIGIAPLAQLPFNALKANTKWVEYTAVGAAVVATAGTIYDGCGADGCARLVDRDGWAGALQALIDDPDERHLQVVRAQDRLVRQFGEGSLRQQVLDVFAAAVETGPPAHREAVPAPEPRPAGLLKAGVA